MNFRSDAESGSTEPIEQQLASARIFLAVILAERAGPLTEPQRDMLATIAEVLDRIIDAFADGSLSAGPGPPPPRC